MTRTRAIYDDPEGVRYGLPTFMWRCAPEGLATLRQLRAAGLRPGGQPIAAQVMWRGVGGTRAAYLYRVDLAKPKRTATPAQRKAITAALEARQTCPTCHIVRPYYIPRSVGQCLTCARLAGMRADGFPRHRYRHGRPQRGQCAGCGGRTSERQYGRWLHGSCVPDDPCSLLLPEVAA